MSAKKVLSALVFPLVLTVLASTAGARIVDGVVAVVNDEPITFSEFRESVAEGLGIPEGDADIYLREERDRDRILRGLEALFESVGCTGCHPIVDHTGQVPRGYHCPGIDNLK